MPLCSRVGVWSGMYILCLYTICLLDRKSITEILLMNEAGLVAKEILELHRWDLK